MMRMKKGLNSFTACALALTLTVTSFALPISTKEVKAAYTGGNAPYINTWLTAGPSDTSVADEIYNQDEILEALPEEIPAETTEETSENRGVLEGEKLNIASAAASTTLSGSDKAYATDGDMETAWKSNTRQGIVWDDACTLTLELESVSEIKGIKMNAYEKDNKQLDAVYTLLDEDGETVKKSAQTDVVNADFTAVAFNKAYNVKKIEVKLKDKGGAPNHLGIREIEVYGVVGKVDVPEEPDTDPENQITPKLKDKFGDAEWEYFDDRIFNRNTDDYQDLYGYYTVKKGMETNGKYVYAHTYVYSPVKQRAELRMVTSGLHKVYVNDRLVNENESAVESSNKDQYKQSINLKEGWNKVLIEIKHTRVHYLGFYARLCDKDGNKIDGLVYSVGGNQEEALKIVTQELNIDRTAFEERNAEIPSNVYPENELPYGYTQWPYVWNKPIHRTSEWAPQASQFQFQAAGGTPEYKWEISEGQLPDGLTMDEAGKIDGFCEKVGEYTFTVKVTDKAGTTAEKETKIIVKERPNKWFEEGKMSALSHDTGAYTQFYDGNFSFDLWAERAKKAGMTLLSTEAVQSVYYWPAPGATNANLQHPNTLEEVDGKLQPKDMVKFVKEAAERHGLRFGVYYASEGSNRLPNGHTNNSSGFVLNVEDLMKRYDPSYLFFDGGPQGKGNVDAMWSSVRAYNDYALIQANDQYEAGDNDLTILETEYTGKMPYVHGGYWEQAMWNENKYTVEEAWTHPFFKEISVWAQYAGGHMRDDWRLFAEYIIYSIGHGIVPNYDQMIVNTRGANWSGIKFASGAKDEYYNLPLNAQEMIDMRDKVNAWMANEGNPDLHESLFGTMPYYFDTYEKKSGWHENSEKEPFLTAKYGEGPDWGYSVARDQYVYMHMQENTMGSGRAKAGFTGQKSMEVGPFDYKVTKVEWLNKGEELAFSTHEKDGKSYIKIDTSSVEADPVDTILKITTDNPSREFKMTDVKLFADQTSATELSLRAEAYMKNFTNVFAPAQLTYTSNNTAVANVDQNGVVSPVGDGKAIITVSAAYEGETAKDTYAVKVRDGKISADEALISVVMRTDGNEAFGKVSTNKNLPITFEARTEKGGGINLLDYDSVTYHYATCDGVRDGDLKEADSYWHANQEVDSLDVLKIENNEVIFEGNIPEETNVAIWADVVLDGNTYTTNKNYLRIEPSYVVNDGVVPAVSSNEKAAENVTDGILNSADGGNTSKWTPKSDDKTPTMTFELDKSYNVNGVRLYFNNKDRYYMNTPQSIKIEVSEDNKKWNTAVEAGEVPTSGTRYFYEDDKYTYGVNEKAKYVRVSFPEGAANNVMDVLEVQILGADDENTLSRIDVKTTIGEDKKSVALDITGYTGGNKEVDLSQGTVSITSDNEAVAALEGNVVKAVGTGTAKITVDASLNGFKASEEFYVKVEEDGTISPIDYLKSFDVSWNDNLLDKDHNAIDVSFSGKLKSGADADMEKAEISCEFSSDKLILENNQIKAKDAIDTNEIVTAKFTATLDGVTLESQELQVILAANYFAVPGKIEAEDGIISGSKVKKEAGDGGTVLGFIQDGDEYTYIVNVEKAGEFEVYYRAVAEQMDKRIQCYVNGELQGGARFDEAGNWNDFSTTKQDENIVLDEGVHVITLKPRGTGYLFNLNWFELVKVEEPEAPVSKKTLEYFLNKAKEHVENGDVESCIESVRKLFAKAIEEGEKVMDDEKATKEEVFSATKNLMLAIQALEMKAGDKKDLEMALELTAIIDLAKYVEAGKEEYLAAKAAAEGVLANGDAMQEEIDGAWNALVDAMGNLRFKADKTTLEELLESLKDLDLSKYTEESAAVYNVALAKAKEVMDDESLSEDDQELVNNTVKVLADARKKLVLKEDSTGGGDNNNGGNNNGDNNNGNNNNNGGGSGDKGNSGNKGDKNNGKDAPKTGDNVNVMLPIILMAFSGGSALMFMVRRRKNKNS